MCSGKLYLHSVIIADSFRLCKFISLLQSLFLFEYIDKITNVADG